MCGYMATLLNLRDSSEKLDTAIKSVFTEVRVVQRGKSNERIMANICKYFIVNVINFEISLPFVLQISNMQSLTLASKWRTYFQRSEIVQFTYRHKFLNYDWFVFTPSFAFCFENVLHIECFPICSIQHTM